MLGYDEYLMAVSRGRGRQTAGLHAHKVGPAHTHRVPLVVAVPLYKIDRRRHAHPAPRRSLSSRSHVRSRSSQKYKSKIGWNFSAFSYYSSCFNVIS